MTAENPILVVTPSQVYADAGEEKIGPTDQRHLWRAQQVGRAFAWATEDGHFGLRGPELVRQEEIGEPISSILLLGDEPAEALIGTAAPHIYHVRGSDHVRRLEAFDELSVRDQWFTPWGGPPHVRSLAATPDAWIYADVEVGSIMVSPDRGGSWEPCGDGVHPDVHHVTTLPAAPDRVYANTQKSVFISDNRGQTWRDCGDDLGHRYGRCIAVHWNHPDLILASVSDGPHDREHDVNGQLYRSTDGGRSWEHVTGGFPDSTPRNINTCHVTFSTDGRAWACEGRRLYVSEDEGGSWRRVWDAPERIVMLSAVLQPGDLTP